MAIVIEEEGSKVNIAQVVTWLVVLLVIVIAVYYIFFAKPDIINLAPPATFQNINPLASVSKNQDLVPDQIAATLEKLKVYVTIPQPGNAGRANPFQPL